MRDIARRIERVEKGLSPTDRFRAVVNALRSADVNAIDALMKAAPQVRLVGVEPAMQRSFMVWSWLAQHHEIRIRDALLAVFAEYTNQTANDEQLGRALSAGAGLLSGWASLCTEHGLDPQGLRYLAGMDEPSPANVLLDDVEPDLEVAANYRASLSATFWRRIGMEKANA